MKKTLLLIDGSSFVFRAFHAMPALTAPDGKPTGATYGIINMLKQMQKKYSSHTHWGCVFDTPHKTFRDTLYPQYKANRAETPALLIPQFEDIHMIIQALGIPMISKSGVEADDIIGTLAQAAIKNNYKVLIATGDKDFAQLVNDDITLINTMNDELLDPTGVINKFGVAPNQIIDYLTLIGDKVDNIPGVNKCGPKTAVKWLTQYKTLDNIIAHQHDLSGVVGENLRLANNWLTTAKKLVTIDTNIPLTEIIPQGLDSLTLRPQQQEELYSAYSRLGFKNWLKQLELSPIADSHESKPQTLINHQPKLCCIHNNLTKTIDNVAELSLTINNILNINLPIAIILIPNHHSNPTGIHYLFIAQGVQTYMVNLMHDLNIYNSNIHIKQVADLFGNDSNTAQNDKQYTNDLFSEDVTDTKNEYKLNNCTNNKIESSKFYQILNQLLSSNHPKIVANYKDILQICTHLNLELNNVTGDLNLAHYIKNSREEHTLSYVFKQYLNTEVIDLPSINPKLAATTHKQLINEHNSLINNCILVINNLIQLEAYICNELDQDELYLYRNIEIPLAKVLVKIETIGITLDIPKFKLLETEISTKLYQLEQKIYKESNCVFNINSPKQLQDVLFNQLALPTAGIKKNSGGYSTNEDTLNLLAAQNIPIATTLLEYRTLNKLLNTYVNKLPKLTDNHNKIHTIFEQALVTSGRLSSHNPNLQNIPIKNALGRRIRQCFIADSEHVLICADYSQIELRILAHLSNDPNLITAFNQNQDIHAITASEIFHKPIHNITTDERRYAKTINFSLLYGKTVYGLALELNIDRITAKKYIDTYFAKFPNVLHTLEKIKHLAHMNHFVTTVFGRRIYLPNINNSNKIIREAEERLALNAPMQGTSADIIKIAMCNIDSWLMQHKLNSRIILQVHDELILHVPNNEINHIKNNLNHLMTACITQLSVNLATNIKVAHNWDEAH